MSARAWRVRVPAAALAAVAVLAARRLEPDPGARALLLYVGVISVGYGHLLGAALPAGRARRVGCARAARVAAGLLAGLALYLALLEALPGVAALLLVASAWHTVENDLALARGRGGPRAPWGGWRLQGAALGGTALLLAAFVACGAGAALASATGAPGLARVAPGDARGLAAACAVALAAFAGRGGRASARLAAAAALFPEALFAELAFAEAFALFGLYHLLSWMLVLVGAGRGRRVLALHALAAGACGVLLAAPGAWAAAARSVVFSPAVYLFASALHVLQTLLARRGARNDDAPAVRPGRVFQTRGVAHGPGARGPREGMDWPRTGPR